MWVSCVTSVSEARAGRPSQWGSEKKGSDAGANCRPEGLFSGAALNQEALLESRNSGTGLKVGPDSMETNVCVCAAYIHTHIHAQTHTFMDPSKHASIHLNSNPLWAELK